MRTMWIAAGMFCLLVIVSCSSETPTPTPRPSSVSIPTLQSTATRVLPTPTPQPTFTASPTPLSAPIFEALVCSSGFDLTQRQPINPSPNKIVSAGTTELYLSGSYRAPKDATYRVNMSVNGVLFESGTFELRATNTGSRMFVGTKRDRRLPSGTWDIEIKPEGEERILYKDQCVIP